MIRTLQIGARGKFVGNLLGILKVYQEIKEELRETLGRTPVFRLRIVESYAPLRRRQNESVFLVFFLDFLMFHSIKSRLKINLNNGMNCKVRVNQSKNGVK